MEKKLSTKEKTSKKPPRKSTATSNKKTSGITTTSVAFKTDNIIGVKSHALREKHRLSVSWIMNQLVEKFLAGEVEIKYP